MSKCRITFSLRLPPYLSPRNDWRKRIHKLALEAVQTRNITLLESDQLQLDVALYLENSALKFHDVDNRLKDIMDALQGRAGGTKRKQVMEPIIPNDNQVYRVTVEKTIAPKQSKGYGHVKVSKYRPSKNQS